MDEMCAHCGGSPEERHFNRYSRGRKRNMGYCYVRCAECFSQTNQFEYEIGDEALRRRAVIKAWNIWNRRV